jgi:hypothetical protein
MAFILTILPCKHESIWGRSVSLTEGIAFCQISVGTAIENITSFASSFDYNQPYQYILDLMLL